MEPCFTLVLATPPRSIWAKSCVKLRQVTSNSRGKLMFTPRNSAPSRVVLPRMGVTLVELLIVVAIVGLLIALLLPAVQAARESARSSACGNNLRQLVVAMQNHEGVRGTLPCSAADLEFLSASGSWGWAAVVLPHLEQTALWERCDFERWPAEEGNRETIETTIPVFRCPSAVADRRQRCDVWDGYEWLSATIPNDNYGLNEHMDAIGSGMPATWAFKEITDGLSNTIMLGETTPFTVSDDAESTWIWSTAWACVISAQRDEAVEIDFWSSVDCNAITQPDQQDWNYLSSHHPHGSHVALCDGAIRVVDRAVHVEVLQSLAEPNDGR